jgi:hypothetical protein
MARNAYPITPTAPGYRDQQASGMFNGPPFSLIEELRNKRQHFVYAPTIAAGGLLGTAGNVLLSLPIFPSVGKYQRIHRVGYGFATTPTGEGALTIDVNKNSTTIFGTAPAWQHRIDSIIDAAEVTLDAAVTFTDGTAAAKDDTDSTDVGDLDAATAAVDYVVIGLSQRWNGLHIDMDASEVNAEASALIVEYWNGSAWVAVTGLIDGTAAGGATLAADGLISWDQILPSRWPATVKPVATMNAATTSHWLRLRFSATLTTTVSINDIDAAKIPNHIYWYETNPVADANRFSLGDILSLVVDEVDAAAASPTIILEYAEEGETDD